MINWKPIEELPDELKDGRQVLLWNSDEPAAWAAVVAYWDAGRVNGWRNDEGDSLLGITHFAAINQPGQQAAFIRDPANPSAAPAILPFGMSDEEMEQWGVSLGDPDSGTRI